MRINIVYEVNNREFNNCLLLQRELIRRGHDARIYNKTENILFNDNSDSITLIPNSYRNEDLDHYRYCFNVNGGIIIVYPCEQVTNHSMPLFFDNTENNKVKYLPQLCWGEDYLDYISSLGFTNSLNSVVGAIQLDFYRSEFRALCKSRADLSSRFNLPSEKKWILFISDFVYSSDILVEHILKGGDQSRDVLEKKHSFSVKSCETILSWFKTILDENNDYIIIYRKHPVEQLTQTIVDFETKYKDRFFAISDLNIKEWIVNCDIISSWYSTSIVECMAAHKGVLILRPYVMDDSSGFTDYDFYRDHMKISSYDEFISQINCYKFNYSSDTISAVNSYYSISDIPSFARVADAIEEIYSNYDVKCFPYDSNFGIRRWKYLLRKFLPFKIIFKKSFQIFYNIFRLQRSFQGESRRAINEWIASAKNKRNYKINAKHMDDIISKYNGKW